MKRPAKISRSQLALPLESMAQYLHPIEEIREEVVTALAELLLEALGTEAIEATHEQGGDDERDEREDHE